MQKIKCANSQSINFLRVMIKLQPVSRLERRTLPIQAQFQISCIAVFKVAEGVGRYDVAQGFAGSHRYFF